MRSFLLRLIVHDDSQCNPSELLDEVAREKYIGDFSNWQDQGHYRQAFSRLVRDLAISGSIESESHA